MIERVKQFIRFGIVGASNTLISYVIYVVLVRWGIHYIAANIIGFLVSVLNAYYWNNRFVFKEKEGEHRIWWKTLIKTFMSYAGTELVLSNILLFVLVEWLEMSEIIAPIVSLLIKVPLNFIMNKYWAFKRQKM